MTDLADIVDSLKRAVAPPGEFVALFPSATDDDLIGTLSDGFAEAQLDGFFTAQYDGAFALDVDAGTVSPDLTHAQAALVIIYAASRVITTRLLNLKTHTRYEARGAVYENDQASGLLVQLLKDFQARKLALQQKAQYAGTNAAFMMADGYYLAATGRYALPVMAGEVYDPYYGAY